MVERFLKESPKVLNRLAYEQSHRFSPMLVGVSEIGGPPHF